MNNQHGIKLLALVPDENRDKAIELLNLHTRAKLTEADELYALQRAELMQARQQIESLQETLASIGKMGEQ